MARTMITDINGNFVEYDPNKHSPEALARADDLLRVLREDPPESMVPIFITAKVIAERLSIPENCVPMLCSHYKIRRIKFDKKFYLAGVGIRYHASDVALMILSLTELTDEQVECGYELTDEQAYQQNAQRIVAEHKQKYEF